MNSIHLQPTDILFFRDGRPMGGSSAGHGEAWPLPTMTDAALHAALHRSGIQGHQHDHRKNRERHSKDARAFGSLTQAGPFPLSPNDLWYFPCPLDLQDRSTLPALQPLNPASPLFSRELSSLPAPLAYPIANRLAPSKERTVPKWISRDAFNAYLSGQDVDTGESSNGLDDGDFSDTEHSIGIGIDSETGTTGSGEAKGKIYSANYLRLREGWRLGLIAETSEKKKTDSDQRDDLIGELFRNEEGILVGGQQRRCTAKLTVVKSSPLPISNVSPSELTKLPNGRYGIKWVLLTPAIFPSTQMHKDRGGSNHPGGWLPNWIDPINGQVLLKAGSTDRGEREPRNAWRNRIRALPSISAQLVASLVGRQISVTGWALASASAEREKGGAKPTLLAVPAGSVYYFETDSEESAIQLSNTLNWHGALGKNDQPTRIVNRRSTSMGEKGFGLGVCSTWTPYNKQSS